MTILAILPPRAVKNLDFIHENLRARSLTFVQLPEKLIFELFFTLLRVFLRNILEFGFNFIYPD